MDRPAEDVLVRYFLGRCSPTEEQAVIIFLAVGIDEQYIEKCWQEAVLQINVHPDRQMTSDELQGKWDKWQLLRDKNSSVRRDILRLQPFKWLAYAASVAALVVFAIGIYFIRSHQISLNGYKQAPSWSKISGTPGKITKVTLADNSTVTLFPGAIINIPRDFNRQQRKVSLSGRAFFQVSHNENKPFEVIAKHVSTKVLGTSFEVNASRQNNESLVTLHTGKVQISQSSRVVALLLPNQQIRISNNGQYNVTEVAAASSLGWMRGDLDYDQTALSAIFEDVENWYNVKVSMPKSINLEQKVTISLINLRLEEVFDLLSKSAVFEYKIVGNKIQIIEKLP